MKWTSSFKDKKLHQNWYKKKQEIWIAPLSIKKKICYLNLPTKETGSEIFTDGFYEIFYK